MASDFFNDSRVTAMGLLIEVHGGILDRLTTALAAHGVSGAEFDVLIRLSRSPNQELRMSDLAAQTTLSTSGVTRVVDRLERGGLVARRACPNDRRGSYAALTEAGVAKVATILPEHAELIERWFTGLLDPDRLTQFLDTLRTIRDVVRPGATAGAELGCPSFAECDGSGETGEPGSIPRQASDASSPASSTGRVNIG